VPWPTRPGRGRDPGPLSGHRNGSLVCRSANARQNIRPHFLEHIDSEQVVKTIETPELLMDEMRGEVLCPTSGVTLLALTVYSSISAATELSAASACRSGVWPARSIVRSRRWVAVIPRKCLRYLTCNPFCRRDCCDVDPDHVSAV